MQKIPTGTLQNPVGKLPKRAEAVIATKRNQFTMNVIKVPVGVLCRFSFRPYSI